MKPAKFFITASLIAVLIFQPVTLFAQGTTGTGGTGGTGTTTGSGGGTYNPSSTSGNGKSFSGTSFSGVGGAIAGCANIGGLLVGSVSGLFKKDKDEGSSAGGGGQSVPTDDEEVGTQTQKIKEEEKKANRMKECLDGVAYAAAKTLLQQVSNKTLTWINKGLGGNATYVQDLTSNLQSIADEQLQSYFDTDPRNTNPIFGNAIRSTLTQQITGISDGYLNKVMDTPEAREYQAFQQDFRQGGWSSFLNPEYNSVGVTLNTADRIARSINSKQEDRTNEVQRNNGFLDMRECVEYEHDRSSTRDGGRDGDTENSESSGKKCVRYRTVTPGSLISNQAQNILGSPVRQLEMADSINEILGAVFNQILDNLLQRGLSSLQNSRSSGTNNFGSFGSNVVIGTNGFPIGTNGVGDAFGYQLPGNGYDVQDFDISRPQMLRDVIQAQKDFLNASRDSQIAMRSIVPVLGALDYCIPGPNPTWEEGLNSNFQTFIAGFEHPSKERSFANKFMRGFLGNDPGGGLQMFAGLFPEGDKILNYMLVGASELFDKVKNNTFEPTTWWQYEYWTKDYDRPVKKVESDWVHNFISAGYERIVQKYKDSFTESKIIALFTAVDSNTATATGNIRESIKETGKLLLYNEAITDLDPDYTQAISDKEDAIAELEDIREKANAIVKTAKARHIAEQAAAGTPVKMSCIDQAYIIDESPIVGQVRKETGVPVDTNIQKSKEARDYFYSTQLK